MRFSLAFIAIFLPLTIGKLEENEDLNPYEVLKIAKGSTYKQIEARYKQLIKLHQPELGGNPKVFHQIKKAFEILTDKWIDKGYKKSVKDRQKKAQEDYQAWETYESAYLNKKTYGGSVYSTRQQFLFALFALFVVVGCFCIVSICGNSPSTVHRPMQRSFFNGSTNSNINRFNASNIHAREDENLSREQLSLLSRLLSDLLERINLSIPRPASQSFINSLRSIQYTSKYYNSRCSICMNNFEEEPSKYIVKVNCDHVFHRECLITWLNKNGSCPNCRFKFPVEVEEEHPNLEIQEEEESSEYSFEDNELDHERFGEDEEELGDWNVVSANTRQRTRARQRIN